jgi:hypothetical protein
VNRRALDARSKHVSPRDQLKALCLRWGWSRTQRPTPDAVAYRLGDCTHELRSAIEQAHAHEIELALGKLESLERSLEAYAELFKDPEPEPAPAPAPAVPPSHVAPQPVVLVAADPALPPLRAISRIEAAKRCGVSLSSFDSYVRTQIGEQRIGGRLVFLESDIEAFLTREKPTTSGGENVRAKRPRRGAGSTLITDPKALAILERFKTKAGKGRSDATH